MRHGCDESQQFNITNLLIGFQGEALKYLKVYIDIFRSLFTENRAAP